MLFVTPFRPAQSLTRSLFKDASTLQVLVLMILAVTCWLCRDCSFNDFLPKLQWALKSLSLKYRLRAEPLVPRAHIDHVTWSQVRETVHIYRATQNAVWIWAETILRTHLNTTGRNFHSDERENEHLHLQLAKHSQQHDVTATEVHTGSTIPPSLRCGIVKRSSVLQRLKMYGGIPPLHSFTANNVMLYTASGQLYTWHFFYKITNKSPITINW